MRVLTLAGSGTQRGLDCGRETGPDIAQAAAALKAHLAAIGHPPAALMRRLSTAGLPHVAADLAPDLWAEVTAVGHAARVDLDELLLLVFAPDLAAYAEPHGSSSPSGSTSAPVLAGTASVRVVPGRPGDDGGGGLPGQAHEPVPPTTEIEQSVGLPRWAAHRVDVLRIGTFDVPNSLVLAYPGSPGLCGANQAGVGIATTALPGAATSREGLGTSFIVRHLLTLETFSAAESFLVSAPHAVGRSYLIAAPDGIGCFEADATGVRRVDDPQAPDITRTDHGEAGAADSDLITAGAFRARGADASARFIGGEALAAGRDWTRLTYT